MAEYEDRFWAKVNKTETCWLWTATTNGVGYGQFNITPRDRRYAHRLSWELLRGPIPQGMVMDHLCRVTLCVNPVHLEVVTRAENNRRGTAVERLIAKHASKTACPNGHEYTDENTRQDHKGHRQCLTCERLAAQRSAARRAARQVA